MKFNLLTICLLIALVNNCFAQTFPVKNLVVNGPASNRVNLVYLPDGFTAGTELNSFQGISSGIQNYVTSLTPFKEYKNFFNAYCIEVPSVESGTTHPGTATDVTEPASPVTTVNTYFKSEFDNGKVHRAVVARNTSGAYAVLNANFPMYDVPMVVCNTSEYGGTGGPILTFTLATAANEIAVHELAHTFGKVWDEYWNNMPGEHPNMTQQSDPNLVKWKNWLNTGGVGIYVHGTGVQASWYRPHQSCKMRQLNQPFCSVCIESIIDQIYKKVTPVNSFSPSNPATTTPQSSTPLTFSFSPVMPDPNTVTYTWMLNGNVLPGSDTSIQINNSQLFVGENTLTAVLTDETALSQSYKPGKGYAHSLVWKIKNDWPSTISNMEGINRFTFKVYPIPASSKLNINFDNDTKATELNYEVLNINGAVAKSGKINITTGEQTIALDINGLASGTYLLNLNGEGVLVNSRFVVE